jgi:flagellar hook-length control protein FliK
MDINNFSLLDINLASSDAMVRKNSIPKLPAGREFSSVYQQTRENANRASDRQKDNNAIKSTQEDKSAENKRLLQQNSLKTTWENNKKHNDEVREQSANKNEEKLSNNDLEGVHQTVVQQAKAEEVISEDSPELTISAESLLREIREDGQKLPYGELSGNVLQGNGIYIEADSERLAEDASIKENEQTDPIVDMDVDNASVMHSDLLSAAEQHAINEAVLNAGVNESGNNPVDGSAQNTSDDYKNEQGIRLDAEAGISTEQSLLDEASESDSDIVESSANTIDKSASAEDDELALIATNNENDELKNTLPPMPGAQNIRNAPDQSNAINATHDEDHNNETEPDKQIDKRSSEKTLDTSVKNAADVIKNAEQDTEHDVKANDEKYAKVLESLGVARNKESKTIENFGLSNANEKLNTKRDENLVSTRSDSITQTKNDHQKSFLDLSKLSTNTKVPLRDTLELPVTHKKWGESLAEKVLLLVNQKGSTARLNLIPHNLGPLEIKLQLQGQLQGEASSIEFVTHHSATKEAIESAIPKLREMFESGGLSLGDVNVKDHSRHSKERGQAHYFTKIERKDNNVSASDESTPNFIKKGRVDYFV